MFSATPLKGQKALVTGGSSGIGAGICRAFAGAGAAVGINYMSSADPAEEMAGEIRRAGGEAITLGADVSDEAQVRAMFERFVAQFGRVDIVMANAGIQKDNPFAKMELAEWNRVLQVNLTGEFLCAREGVRRFLAQAPSSVSKARGKIICMSSVHEVIPWAGHVNYAASKGGVMLMMKSLAQEVAPHRIRVNSIAPGAIRTPINRPAWETNEALARLLGLIPYGRIGEPEDVARAAVWLASDDADYVTGTTIFVDGGMCLYP
ncbi:MAG TPA: glucose 1-dehydrogenase, partial [Usitatibacter sp.]|nr:glucose 1-dehydrogenase [Usitatibacter sp.]